MNIWGFLCDFLRMSAFERSAFADILWSSWDHSDVIILQLGAGPEREKTIALSERVAAETTKQREPAQAFISLKRN